MLRNFAEATRETLEAVLFAMDKFAVAQGRWRESGYVDRADYTRPRSSVWRGARSHPSYWRPR